MPPAPAPPPCSRLGRQCHAVPVTLRASNDLTNPAAGDHETTWLLGHTERLTFGKLWRHKGDLFVQTMIHIPCKYLESDGQKATCRAHGFTGRAPVAPVRAPQPRRVGDDRFRLVSRGRLVEQTLRKPKPRPRSLPIVDGGNPCATAACRTADNSRGAACCRDLQIEIMCDVSWFRQEALIRSRKSPYLCKVQRDKDESLEVEVISACDYLGDDDISCSLHGRKRPDRRQAKPDLCRRWPVPTEDETLHPGCVFFRPAPGPDV